LEASSMSKLITRASVAGATLVGSALKTSLTGLVDALNSAGIQEGARTTVSVSTTLTLTQAGLVLVDATSASVVLTLPSSGLATDDAVFLFRRLDSSANTVTVQRGGTDTIESSTAALSVASGGGILGLQIPAGSINWRVYSQTALAAAALLVQTGLGAELIKQTATALTSAGTAPAYTLTSSLGGTTALAAGQRFRVKFHSAGTLGSNTLNRDGLGAKNLMRYDAAGNKTAAVVAANQLADVEYDGVDMVVLTPATGSQIESLPNPTLAANAMTLPASVHTLDFRSATLGIGVVSTVSGTAAALVIPSGATLGTVNAVQSTLVEVILNNAGVLEKAIVNVAGGNDLSETGVISTTAISAAATAANVFYSNTARTNVAYRVVRAITSTQATAGTWVTAPSLVQGMGGNALTAMSSLGYGQTWQAVTRTSGTTYYNTTGKPITIHQSAVGANSAFTLTIGGVALPQISNSSLGINEGSTYVIPPGASYVSSNAGTVSAYELR
jgi:hypothetical protein